MTRRREASRDERGAVAVMTGVLASLLLITAALSVDLGNAWARKRDLQTQADIAALAAANWGKDQTPSLFPAVTPAQKAALATKVAEYMLKGDNAVAGQNELTEEELAAALLDEPADFTDGQLVFSDDGHEMRVVAPSATVNFGLAGVFGFTDVDVLAEATVSLFSELPGSDVLPFWLPDGCAYGPVDADTTNGKGTGKGVKTDGDTPLQATVSPASTSIGSTTVLTFLVEKKNEIDTSKPSFVAFQHSSGTSYDLSGVWGGDAQDAKKFTVTVGPDDVTGTSGSWSFQVDNGGKLSTLGNFAVTAPAPVDPADPSESTDPLPTTCVGSDEGNFGQLMSPRAGDAYNHQRDLALNIAEGLDHQLVPYPNAPADNCEKPTLLANAKLDNAPVDGNNCITGSTGNDGPWIFDGLIGGVEGKDGRLDISRGATKAGCNGGNATVNGKTINNDLLTCYLKGGFSLSQLVNDSADDGMLDPSVTDSPRFVWMPVVYAPDRTIKDFQPLLKFVPGFITDETAGTNSSTNATANNGIEIDGNSVKSLKVFTFHPNALQESDRSPVTGYDPVLQRDTLRLID